MRSYNLFTFNTQKSIFISTIEIKTNLAWISVYYVYVSAQSFKHYSCCFRTPLVRFLGPWPNFVYLYTCKLPDARCRPWLLLLDSFRTCSTTSRGGLGSISFVLMGREEWPKHSRLALCHTQRSPTCWDPYLSLPVPGRNQNAQLSLHQQLDRLYCHSHIHIVKSRPRWPHTWRYALSPCHALPWIHVLAIQMVIV